MTIKLGTVIYNKLLLQAEEAKNQNLDRLSSGIYSALENGESNEIISYNYSDLNNDIYCGLWKLASNIIKYHNLESVDAEIINNTIEALASKFINEMELTLNTDDKIAGPFEETLPGEVK
jgi:hypothetical protein